MPEMPADELTGRIARFTDLSQPLALDGLALFHSHNVGYLSGFDFIPTERPIAYISSTSGEAVLVVPELEAEHAASAGGVARVVSYDEFPGDVHPMELVRQVLADLGLDRRGCRVGAGHRFSVYRRLQIDRGRLRRRERESEERMPCDSRRRS